jgi:hypothetical protein
VVKIAITDRRDRLVSFLPAFREAPLSYSEVSAFPERRTTLAVAMAMPVSDLRACRIDFFFDYDIFPSSILSAFGEWRLESRVMRAGDVIVQTRSRPAQLPARLVAPVLVNPYQQYCTRRALAHMCKRFLEMNGGMGPTRPSTTRSDSPVTL